MNWLLSETWQSREQLLLLGQERRQGGQIALVGAEIENRTGVS
jgi:hypothetical protein